MIVTITDIQNAIYKAQNMVYAIALNITDCYEQGGQPSDEKYELATQLQSYIDVLGRVDLDENDCIDSDEIWEIISWINGNQVLAEMCLVIPAQYSNPGQPIVNQDGGCCGVETVTGPQVDNTDPKHPVVGVYGDGSTITGAGTFADPFVASGGGGGAVSSVFGRTGAVTAQSGDYNTSQVTEVTNLYFTVARVLATALTGLSVTGSNIVATDTILQAFGKAQNQINALVGGVNYQGVWNATTNTPALASGVGTKGYYYVVSVAGSTNLDGITDWKLGDWAIFNGATWQKVDNTDAVISVNGLVGAVTLTTADITEVTNLYFTDARAIAASLTGFAAAAGTVSAADSVLGAFNKIVGNIASILIPIQMGWDSQSLLDNTTYYFGEFPQLSLPAVGTVRKTQFTQNLTLVGVNIQGIVAGTLGTAEDATIAIGIDNTTWTTISSTVKFNALFQQQVVSGLSVAVTTSNTIQLRLVTPLNYVTNPLLTYGAVTLYFRLT